MSGFLDRMAETSRARLEESRAREPLAALRARALATPRPLALQLHGRFNLIAEFKRRSPSLGRLGDDDLIARATAYARGGAAAVSILTEPAQFHGSLEHLETAAGTLAPLGVPVMRKDFLLDPYQLYEALRRRRQRRAADRSNAVPRCACRMCRLRPWSGSLRSAGVLRSR